MKTIGEFASRLKRTVVEDMDLRCIGVDMVIDDLLFATRKDPPINKKNILTFSKKVGSSLVKNNLPPAESAEAREFVEKMRGRFFEKVILEAKETSKVVITMEELNGSKLEFKSSSKKH